MPNASQTHTIDTTSIASENSVADLPVVLLHGWGGTPECIWEKAGWHTRLQSCGRVVINLELPGHGSGRASHDPAAYADIASQVEQQLPQAFDAIGFSLGAKILLEIAARGGHQIRRLALLGVGGNVFQPERGGGALAEELEACANGSRAPQSPLALYGIANGNDPMALAACLRRAHNPVLDAERLRKVTAPVLLICGDADTLAQPLAPLFDALPNADLSVLSGVDHIGLPASQACLEQSIDFIQKERDAHEA